MTFDTVPIPDDGKTASDDAPYGYTPTGRIRKRPVGGKSSGETVRTKGRGAAKAEQAADALVVTHMMVAPALLFAGMPGTAASLVSAQDDFRKAVIPALEANPSLCAMLLRVGKKSSALALLGAYVGMVSTVVTENPDECAPVLSAAGAGVSKLTSKLRPSRSE